MTWPYTLANESYFRFYDDKKVNYNFDNHQKRHELVETLHPHLLHYENFQNEVNFILPVNR